MKKQIAIDDLEECYKKMALIVKVYGNSYLPIFERLHQEIENKMHNVSMLNLALKVADDILENRSQIRSQNSSLSKP